MIRRVAKEDRTDADGIVHDSRGEMKRWCDLQLLEKAGKITNLRRQVKFPLVIGGKPILIRSERYPNGRACSYRADFVYLDIDNSEEWPLRDTVEDFKAFATEAARLRIAIAEAIHGFRVKISGPNVQRKGGRRRR